MIGSVIITHGRLAEALLEAAESISGRIEGVRTLSISQSDTAGGIRDVLTAAVKEVDSGSGVVLFTDMFGGTPTNISLSTFEAGRVEVITGVNLPMVLKYVSHRSEKSLEELTILLKDYGQKAIVLAGEMLREKK
ncbi:MAG TPA: PTS sugar transporter [Deltaproteobacteria bacterium]|nr:MAG: PTS sugar transporter [Deltaproteobacteria bacterium GWA2_55_82]OGQ62213.1 MAG: PTS sugar transporter [Deltaproteobacteria bacterium RIFCSPLOWO2_02_FULL_55_12]OIJ73254.1 MAG: PTS sugar transporter [Deltaproteobacteria bacterium GWC2_55_46]HBG45483.1 PTS sugar transporter [Deltaproteobacteria bacterium]HCY10314.1 PTS sugar transporter [Deltaproteobacteria bacterium]